MSKQSAIQDGRINVAHAKKKRRLDQEFERVLERVQEKRDHLARVEKKLQQLDWKGSQKLFKKIAKSATYKKLCENEVGSTKKSTNCSLVKKKFRGATAGRVTWYGAMELQENNCPYTIIHEFAHLCGNMHHDIGFRRDVIKLASMFISKEFGMILKKCFKEAKLKITTGSHIMSPEQWIASVMRMEKIRERNS